MIPHNTYTNYFTNQETQDSGVALDNNTINNIKNYVLANEKSSLNLVSKNDVVVSEPVKKSDDAVNLA